MNSKETLKQWHREWEEKNKKLVSIGTKTLIETDWENITKEEFMKLYDEQNK